MGAYTFIPVSLSVLRVPSVDITSIPRVSSPFANSTMPVVLVLANIFSGLASFSDEENRMLSQRPEPNYLNIFSGRRKDLESALFS